jgi:EpsI family protein
MPKFLSSTPARVVTILLVLQAALLYSSIRPEAVPASRALAGVPPSLGNWQFERDETIDPEMLQVLNADDVLNRSYVLPASNASANLFVAAFLSQRNGKVPHSPKNCLPGSGWTPLVSDEFNVDVGGPSPLTVNRYVIAHGDSRSLVLYWYQSRDRVVASEYKAKFWVVVDAIRLNRTDTALVRVIVPITGRDQDQATATAVNFVRSFYSTLRTYLPA